MLGVLHRIPGTSIHYRIYVYPVPRYVRRRSPRRKQGVVCVSKDFRGGIGPISGRAVQRPNPLSHSIRIRLVHRITTAVTEEVAVARSKTHWVFAHEAAQAGMIGPGAILVEAEIGNPLPAGEEIPVVDHGVAKGRSPPRITRDRRPVDLRCAKGIVAILLDHITVNACHRARAPKPILKRKLRSTVVASRDNFIHSQPIQSRFRNREHVGRQLAGKDRPDAIII